MGEVPIEFIDIEWIQSAQGFRYKELIKGDKKIRLAEYSEGFIENDWCKKGHEGYVVEGILKLNFNGNISIFNRGNDILILEGEENKHKLIIENDDKVLLILIENEEKLDT